MGKCQMLLKASVIVTQNESREILHDAAIAVNMGKITAIGPAEAMERQWQASEILDYSSCLLMPGLINAHTHGAMTFLRGLADDLPLMDWLQHNVFPVERRLTPDIVRLGALLGHAEMLATGTTACIDMYIHEDAVLEAADQAGIRCMGGEAVFQFPSAACANHRDAIQRTADLAARYADHERLSVAVNPHAVYTTTDDILRDCRRLALELDLPIHIHLAETATETAQSLDLHGRRPLAQLAHCGLLDARLVCAHMVDINGEEIALLREANACAVHNPASNMKLASGTAPVSSMLATGLVVALGTDGPASNNQLNIFADMRLTALLHKLTTGDPAAVPAQAVLDMATLGGASALGRADLGRLQPGFQADIVAIRLSAPNMLPLHNPVSQLVYATSGHECCMTMVNGEILYRDNQFTRFSHTDLLEEMARLRQFAISQK